MICQKKGSSGNLVVWPLYLLVQTTGPESLLTFSSGQVVGWAIGIGLAIITTLVTVAVAFSRSVSNSVEKVTSRVDSRMSMVDARLEVIAGDLTAVRERLGKWAGRYESFERGTERAIGDLNQRLDAFTRNHGSGRTGRD